MITSRQYFYQLISGQRHVKTRQLWYFGLGLIHLGYSWVLISCDPWMRSLPAGYCRKNLKLNHQFSNKNPNMNEHDIDIIYDDYTSQLYPTNYTYSHVLSVCIDDHGLFFGQRSRKTSWLLWRHGRGCLGCRGRVNEPWESLVSNTGNHPLDYGRPELFSLVILFVF